MNQKSILSPTQEKFLKLFGAKKTLSRNFYLTEGTALTAFYIPYRYSEDLDFFSFKEVDLNSIISFIRSIKKGLFYKSLDISTSFNRNLIFIEFPKKQILKTEFTYFPFPQIEKPKENLGVKTDSLIDIATNKLFTIYQKPRSRDFIDLYMIIEKYGFSLDDLVKKARAKFDWSIDFIQLGTQFLEVKNLKDYPRFIEPVEKTKWQDFFLLEAKKLKKQILKN